MESLIGQEIMAAKSSEKGFSLVELMVALAVLAIGMSAIGTMLINAFWHDRHNTQVRNAEAILRRVAEGFVAGNPENLLPSITPLTPAPPWAPGTPGATGNAVVRGQSEKTVSSQKITGLNFVSPADGNVGTYYCQWSIWTYKVSSAGIVSRIDVVVGWGNSQGGAPCDANSPGTCPRHLQLTNYF
ncbi:MAG: prepilin-type N-terminal cleavage/methylation domain-containing protein [Desulfomonile tiedjei]|nr:prepilin-type N-terminal cleavage/methylation domain-containing protein [Desulfomonile tiedjei]